jgi:hypothetical protein
MEHRVINYKNIVDTSAIIIDCKSSGDTTYRYSLTIPFNRKGEKSVLVVMMNPSKATDKVSDNTINKVLTRIHNECPEVSKVTITNLYPLYETYSDKLENHKIESQANFDKMRLLMEQNDFVLLGWGKPSNKSNKVLQEIKYHEHALKVVEMVQSLELPAFIVDDLRSNLYPRHLGRLSFDLKMSTIDLSELIIKINNKISVNLRAS